MDQSERNAREQNQQGGQNKPRQQPDSKEDNDKSGDEQEGRDEAPKNRPGAEKSPWLGGG
jgi:hypothetical protein